MWFLIAVILRIGTVVFSITRKERWGFFVFRASLDVFMILGLLLSFCIINVKTRN